MFLACSFGSFSATALAEPASGAVYSPNEAISHIEQALVEISKSDFNSAQVHMKAARASSEKVTGKADVVKKATAGIIQAQIKAKLGDVKSATDELNKVLELYKTL